MKPSSARSTPWSQDRKLAEALRKTDIGKAAIDCATESPKKNLKTQERGFPDIDPLESFSSLSSPNEAKGLTLVDDQGGDAKENPAIE